MMKAGELLAKLAKEAAAVEGLPVLIFGTVTAFTSTTVTVQPDGGLAVVIGPMPLVGTAALAVNDRAAILRTADGAYCCIGKII